MQRSLDPRTALRPRVPKLKEKKAEGEREGVQRAGEFSGQMPPLTRGCSGCAPGFFLLALGERTPKHFVVSGNCCLHSVELPLLPLLIGLPLILALCD